jgi:hypothetical protein
MHGNINEKLWNKFHLFIIKLLPELSKNNLLLYRLLLLLFQSNFLRRDSVCTKFVKHKHLKTILYSSLKHNQVLFKYD